MSDLLAIGRSGVMAYRNALSTVGENVSNAETEGYARRTVKLADVSTSGGQVLYKATTSFSGVASTSVLRAWDDYKATEVRTGLSDNGRADARLRWLNTTEAALDDGASGVGKQLTAVFTAADALAADPASAAGRSNFLTAIDGAASALRTTAGALARAATGVSTEAGSTIDAANADLAQLAKLNHTIGRLDAGSAAFAQASDERDRLTAGLSARLGVDVAIQGDGQVRVTLAGASSTALVAGDGAASLKLTASADGRLALSISAATGETPIFPTGGALAGQIDAAATIADHRQSLDALATQFAGEINDWQAAGLTDAGAAGAPLVTIGATAAAATVAIATRDTSAIAVASADPSGTGTGTTIANGNALALAALRGASGTEARWSAMVTGQAQSTASAKSEAAAAGSRKDNALSSLDDVAGVDLDREAADLLRFQQAYSASAKIIQVARETLQQILQLF